MAEKKRGRGNPNWVKGTSGNPSGKSKENYESRPGTGDGWASALTGLGTTARDKRLSHSFSACALTYQEIANLWEKDDIVSKAIEGVAGECFREGYEITIGDEGSYEDLKEEIEESLIELDADTAIELAYSYKRAYGGAAILLGAHDGRPLNAPLEVERVRSLEWLKVFEPIEIVPAKYYNNPGEAKYGEPEFFQLNNYGDAGTTFIGSSGKAKVPKANAMTLIHESRLAVFQGIKTSNYIKTRNQISPFWGANVVDRFIDSLRDFGIAYQGAGLIATDVSQPIIAIQGLREMVAKGESRLRDRMAALELSRSTARAILLDADKERFERQTTQLSGIPELLDRLSLRLSAAIDMPLSILLGYNPATMGKPGDSEMTQWYNKIRAIQRRQLSPILRLLTKMIMRSLRQRKIPKKWGIRWNELERMTDGQRAEARLTQARTDSLYVKAGVLSCDEVRRSRFLGEYSFETQIEEKEEAPGFMAPLPAGVMPGSAPAGGSLKPSGPNAHSVGGYSRRNPTQPALGKNPEQGGDAPPKTDHVDNGPGAYCEFAGFNVVIENAKGSKREWVDTDGTLGVTKMKYDYGYIEDSVGSDGDSIDVYLGPSEDAEWVYVIHQRSKRNNFETYDEDKVMLGFDSANHAKDAYLSQYDDERFFGGMSQLSIHNFREKVKQITGPVTF